MKKDVLMIAHFCSDFDEKKGNNRFNFLAHLLSKNNMNVELVTSDFSHSRKKKRMKVKMADGYKVTLISEPVYTSNISLKRFYSHFVMGRNLEKYLNTRKVPDCIYCAVPSLDVARIAANYAKKHDVEFIIDVQDLWPEAFKMVVDVPFISELLFYPMTKQADYVYSTADKVVAVSDTYIQRVLSAQSDKETHCIYLGTELSSFDEMANRNKLINKPKDEFWLAYIGTLGHSYNLPIVIDALKILGDEGLRGIKFTVMGDGPLRAKFEHYAQSQDVPVEFTGMLEYGKMVGMLKACDVAVNPIRQGSAGSIINKVGDYAAAGLPVINTQQCQEYRDLLDKYKAGISCDNAVDMAKIIVKLYKDKHYRMTMGKNSRKLAEDKFDREVTYKKILDLIAQSSNTKSIKIPEDTHDSQGV